MMKALLRVRFRALFAGMTSQSRTKGKRRGKGTLVLFALLYVYVLVVFCGMTGALFYALAEPYHALGLDWLYFAMAGLMGLAFAIFGSVFSTQSQLYDAKDNELLLAMPLPPRKILLSRIVPLLFLNLLFAGVVMLPAIVVYAAVIGPSGYIPLQILAYCGVVVLAQTLACLLGYLLHLLISKMNKSVASMLYMVLFFAVYFTCYSQANKILTAMAASGEAIAGALQTWVWPLYAMGRGCVDAPWMFAVFLVICAALFAIAYAILSKTFLRAATARHSSRRKRKLDLHAVQATTPGRAIVRKELRKFLGCPVYLTNMGMGIILALLLPVAGVIFRSKILVMLEMLQLPGSTIALIVCAVVAFMVSTCCVSTPSVSLEGKNIWILKSMPVSPAQILRAKLDFHCLLTVPVSALAALVLTLAFGCGAADAVLATLVAGLLAVLCGVLGMICGLHWARLDYISEAYPCKQSVSVLVILFGMMGVPLVFGLVYGFLLAKFLSGTAFLAIVVVLLGIVNALLYRAMVTWGARKWESLN